VLGSCTPAGRDAFQMYHEGAVDVPGPAINVLSQVAGDNKVFLVTGAIERDLGTLYCVVLFFSPEGQFLGKHRKLMPTGTERLVWGFGDGSTLPVFKTEFGNIGAVICWENYMPMLRMTMYAKGVTIYCAPTADHRETWLPTMQHIAREGRCYVLSACQFGRRSDFPPDYPIEGDVKPDDVLAKGGSCIIDPLGEVLCGPVFDEDLIHTASIDPAEVTRARFDFDVVGHSSRPDLFTLTVDEQQRSVVQSTLDINAVMTSGRSPCMTIDA
jgi:nitrilase